MHKSHSLRGTGPDSSSKDDPRGGDFRLVRRAGSQLYPPPACEESSRRVLQCEGPVRPLQRVLPPFPPTVVHTHREFNEVDHYYTLLYYYYYLCMMHEFLYVVCWYYR